MTRILSMAQFASFLREKPFVVVHFDSAWDLAYRPILQRKLRDAELSFGDQASFGEVDCDQSWDLVRSIPVLNVPTIAYYGKGRLVAALIGPRQNVLLRLERLLRGNAIGYRDGADRDDELRFWPYTR